MKRCAVAFFALFVTGFAAWCAGQGPTENASSKAAKASVSISGTIRNDAGTPLCALVLANGQFMFSCSPVGSYTLDLPLDSSGQYTLFGFAEGHFPYKGVFSNAGRHDIVLSPATKYSGEALVPKNLTKTSVHITGTVRNESLAPLSALVLANGQFTFSSGANGSYSLDVPLDVNGQYTLYVFAEGHFPYKGVFNAGGQRDVTASMARPPSTLRIEVTQPPAAIAGKPYNAFKIAQGYGGTGEPYHYQLDTLANGAPPIGMSVDLNGYLVGTPSSSYNTAQTFTFGVCVADLAATIKCAPASVTVNPAQQMSTMAWTMSDQCNNGQALWLRFFDRDNGMQWPENRANAYKMFYGDSGRVELGCIRGAKVCYGAESDDHRFHWGVGLRGTDGCSDCCELCNGGTYSRPPLRCDSVPSTSYYANWSCGSSGSCAAVMGGAVGTAGPFCSLTDCQRWGQAKIPGGYSCSTVPSYSPVPGGSTCYTY